MQLNICTKYKMPTDYKQEIIERLDGTAARKRISEAKDRPARALPSPRGFDPQGR